VLLAGDSVGPLALLVRKPERLQDPLAAISSRGGSYLIIESDDKILGLTVGR